MANLGYVRVSTAEQNDQRQKEALEKYKRIHNGKKPQAHKVAKIGYLIDKIHFSPLKERKVDYS